MKLKRKEEEATETYISERGYYVIKQSRESFETGHDEDILILLSPDQMKALITDLQDTLSEVEECWSLAHSPESENDNG